MATSLFFDFAIIATSSVRAPKRAQWTFLRKKPRGSEACVWTIWKDVKLLFTAAVLHDFPLNRFPPFYSLPFQQRQLKCNFVSRGAVNLIPSTAQRRRWFEIVISGLIIPTYLQCPIFIFVVHGHRLSPEPACRPSKLFVLKLLRLFIGDWAASEPWAALSKGVEGIPSHRFSLQVLQPCLSALTELFVHVWCIPHQEFDKIFLSKCEKLLYVKFVCCVYVRVCVEAGGGRRRRSRRSRPGIQNQKQEPHAKLWGKTSASHYFWKFRCRKSACRCGAKCISKWKCKKSRGSDHFWRFRCCFVWQGQGVQKWAREGFVAFPKTMAGTGHLKRICKDAKCNPFQEISTLTS